MFDLEERLRAEARQEAGAFVPSPDLPQRVVTGIRRRRQRRIALASAAAVLVVGLGAAGLAALSGDTGHVEMAPPANQPGGTSAKTTATTTAATTPTTADHSTSNPSSTTVPTATTPVPEAATPDPTTAPTSSTAPTPESGAPALSWTGVRGIVNGEVLSSAQAAGVTFTWNQQEFESFGRVCFTAHAADYEGLRFLVKAPGGTPLADPLDGYIDQVGGPEARTVDGIGAGSTVDELRATYGEPARTEDDRLYAGRQLWVYEANGGALGFAVLDGVVTEAWTGTVNVGDLEPCA